MRRRSGDGEGSRAVALLTDFGSDDQFVGAMKGVVLSINRQAAVVDITHNIRPRDIRSAAFVLSACWREFPLGTVFLAVVDPGVGTERRAIGAEVDGRFFVAPDNGLLSLVFDAAEEEPRVFQLADERFRRGRVSMTFHGRDIFAPAAAHISIGTDLEEFGPEVNDPVYENFGSVRGENGEITGQVLHIDRFGNVITNLRPGDLLAGSTIITGGMEIRDFAGTFAEIPAGKVAAIEGSAGYIELAADRDSAARILGIAGGQKVIVRSESGAA